MAWGNYTACQLPVCKRLRISYRDYGEMEKNIFSRILSERLNIQKKYLDETRGTGGEAEEMRSLQVCLWAQVVPSFHLRTVAPGGCRTFVFLSTVTLLEQSSIPLASPPFFQAALSLLSKGMQSKYFINTGLKNFYDPNYFKLFPCFRQTMNK